MDKTGVAGERFKSRPSWPGKLMSADPVKHFTLLVLFQAQQDNAEELVIAPSSDQGAAIRYKIGGRWHDFSPPPPHILPGVIAELGKLAAFSEPAFPKEGTIDVPFSGIRLRWEIRQSAADGECVLTPSAR